MSESADGRAESVDRFVRTMVHRPQLARGAVDGYPMYHAVSPQPLSPSVAVRHVSEHEARGEMSRCRTHGRARQRRPHATQIHSARTGHIYDAPDGVNAERRLHRRRPRWPALPVRGPVLRTGTPVPRSFDRGSRERDARTALAGAAEVRAFPVSSRLTTAT